MRPIYFSRSILDVVRASLCAVCLQRVHLALEVLNLAVAVIFKCLEESGADGDIAAQTAAGLVVRHRVGQALFDADEVALAENLFDAPLGQRGPAEVRAIVRHEGEWNHLGTAQRNTPRHATLTRPGGGPLQSADVWWQSRQLPAIMRSMDETAFEELVEEAVASIPDVFLEMLDNVAIVVEDWPDRETMRLARVGSHYQLLGFYHGIPKTGRNSGYNLVAPDRISIYRRPIEAQCRSEEELREMVRRVVLHELAHHFGIDDSRLHEIGAY